MIVLVIFIWFYFLIGVGVSFGYSDTEKVSSQYTYFCVLLWPLVIGVLLGRLEDNLENDKE